MGLFDIMTLFIKKGFNCSLLSTGFPWEHVMCSYQNQAAFALAWLVSVAIFTGIVVAVMKTR